MSQTWLNERENRAWRGFQRMRVEVNAVLARRLARDFGLTEADFVIFLILSGTPGHRLRARDLANALHWERSRLSRQISRMEARGTVTRAPSEGDARGFDVVLTEAGRAAFEAAFPAYAEGVRHCFADVLSPDQLDALSCIAGAIISHVRLEHCACAPNDLAADGDGATVVGIEPCTDAGEPESAC